MIERWFPCAEVSAASGAGWGSGNTERNLFSWFAARPVAQAKAAVITSLLKWPDDETEQESMRELVREALTGRHAAWTKLREHILESEGGTVSVLDPFSGRGMIPLEAARLGLRSYGVDYSPVAVLGSQLLTDYPFRNWDDEPELPFVNTEDDASLAITNRLVSDAAAIHQEVGRRHRHAMARYYPTVNGREPWGYLWSVTQPCQDCGRRFPVIGSLALRPASTKRGRGGQQDRVDLGQSFKIMADPASGTFTTEVHDGPPTQNPTFVNQVHGGKKVRGKSAVCPFCGHVHPLATHQRLSQAGDVGDTLLVVADLDSDVGKTYRVPTASELESAEKAREDLALAQAVMPGLPAVPDEEIPLNNGATIRPQLYGATTYGDLMCPRQTLSFVQLTSAIREVGDALVHSGVSTEYANALLGYCVATMLRKLKRSTRGSNLDVSRQSVNHIFVNESTIAYSQDYFETGIGDGPGTWASLSSGGAATLAKLVDAGQGVPTRITHGSAVTVPYRTGSMSAVVTDPPYDAMVYYSDSSDLYFAWAKRALVHIRPEFGVTSDQRGIQDKTQEIIVKEHGKSPGEHRDRTHYDTLIAEAFAEMRRVVHDDGLVTIVFGHGEPEVWKRLLGALAAANLVMTGSWPARTESGGQQGKANIETTLTMCCRPAAANRPEGRRAAVEAAVRREVKERIELWARSGLAPTDMLMASAGPAMEVVGRYERVLDARGEPVGLEVFLPIARQAVQEAEAIEIDHHPLETFDARTRFALWWVRLFGRSLAPKSELRWQVLASSLDLTEVRDLVPDATKGCQFVESRKFTRHITPESSVIDIALGMAKAWAAGLDAVGEVVADAGRDVDDAYLWAAISFLADRLPDSDPDAIAWTGILRNKRNVGTAARGTVAASERARRDAAAQSAQQTLDLGDFDLGPGLEMRVTLTVEGPDDGKEGKDG